MQQEQALRRQPDSAQADNELGLTYGKSGKHRGGNQGIQEAILKKPDYGEAIITWRSYISYIERFKSRVAQI